MALRLVLLAVLLPAVFSQCDRQRDFPTSVTLKGREVTCTPTPADDPCWDIDEFYYNCNNMRAGGAAVGFDLEEGTDTVALCRDLLAAVGEGTGDSSTTTIDASTPGTVIYTEDGWSDANTEDSYLEISCATNRTSLY